MPRARAAADNERLDSAAWVQAALEVLAESGVAAVRVEPLARRLKITKGSFYWHFKDRDDLLTAMLAAWRRQATLNIIARIERLDQPPAEKLRQLIDLPLVGRRSADGAGLELAVRVWAKSDPRAAEALAEIDQQRLAHIVGLVKGSGVRDDVEAQGRAYLYYAYILAEAFVPVPLTPEARAVCDHVLAAPAPAPRKKAQKAT